MGSNGLYKSVALSAVGRDPWDEMRGVFPLRGPKWPVDYIGLLGLTVFWYASYRWIEWKSRQDPFPFLRDLIERQRALSDEERRRASGEAGDAVDGRRTARGSDLSGQERRLVTEAVEALRSGLEAYVSEHESDPNDGVLRRSRAGTRPGVRGGDGCLPAKD